MISALNHLPLLNGSKRNEGERGRRGEEENGRRGEEENGRMGDEWT